MTPQELIDLPGYGQAVKRVKAIGAWHETMSDTERIEWLAENAEAIIRNDWSQSWKIVLNGDDYDPEFFRNDIDKYATARMQGLYSGYLEETA